LAIADYSDVRSAIVCRLAGFPWAAPGSGKPKELWTIPDSLAGGFLIFLYEHWAVKRGFQAWTILAGNEGQVITPSWRKLWWWILISLVVLFNGLIAGVMLQKMMAG
jgi:hypothetical protein